MRSLLAKHIVQRLSSKRVRQIEIRLPDTVSLLTSPRAPPRKRVGSGDETRVQYSALNHNCVNRVVWLHFA